MGHEARPCPGHECLRKYIDITWMLTHLRYVYANAEHLLDWRWLRAMLRQLWTVKLNIEATLAFAEFLAGTGLRLTNISETIGNNRLKRCPIPVGSLPTLHNWIVLHWGFSFLQYVTMVLGINHISNNTFSIFYHPPPWLSTVIPSCVFSV
jgi:hypothetical protein